MGKTSAKGFVAEAPDFLDPMCVGIAREGTETESGKRNRDGGSMDETTKNNRREFLHALMAAVLVTGAASETVSAQQAADSEKPANSRPGVKRLPLPAPFTGMDAAFAQITIQPGAAPSHPHTHSGFVLGYVIEGDYLFGINGETPRVVHAGEIFYEPPGATHTTHASAKPDETVRLLAIVIGPQGAAILTPVR